MNYLKITDIEASNIAEGFVRFHKKDKKHL